MSIIVWRAGVLAADSGTFSGQVRVGVSKKIGKTRDGWLWGFVGETQYTQAFAEWAEHRGGRPVKFDCKESGAILISPDGEVSEWEGDGWIKPNAPFHAWGCAGEMAVGALGVGAGAEKAVAVCIEFCIYCTGPVVWLRPGIEPPAEDDGQGELIMPDPPSPPPTWKQARGLE